MATEDYYKTLGVARNASADEIKAAYRKQALKFHPDRNPDNKQSEEKLKTINEAYSVLSDDQKRQVYDQYGHAGVTGSGAAGGRGFSGFDFGGFGDIFGDIFEEAFGGRGGRRRGGNRHGRDLRVDHEVSLEKVLSGTEVSLTVPTLNPCDTCGGNGAKPGSKMKICSGCNGQGQVRVSQGFFTMAQTCPRCHGHGQIIENPCQACQGNGRVEKRKQVRVRIPPGVENGTTLRIASAGEAGERGAPSGDLYVVIRVKADKRFERNGSDLLIESDISFPLATLGGEIEVPSLDGSVRLRIPAGTQPGVQFRVAGRGLPHLKSRGRGDLFVQVQVVVPKKLKKEEKKLIQELGQRFGEKGLSKDEGVFKKVFGGIGPMPQVLVDPKNITSSHFSLSGSEAHHLIRVLRKKINDEIDFFDGKGTQFRGRILSIDPVSLDIHGKIIQSLTPQKSVPPVYLYQGLPKGSKFDFVIEKATELGVFAIVPFLSEKNVIKLDQTRTKAKTERWVKLAHAAAKQSGNHRIPDIHQPRFLAHCVDDFRLRETLVCDTGNQLPSLKAQIRNRPSAKGPLNLVIGPESGWTDKERKWFESIEVKIVSLGSAVFRTETAGMVALAAWSYENS